MKLLDTLYENIQFIKDTESWSMYHIPGRVHVIFIKIIFDIKYWMRLN